MILDSNVNITTQYIEFKYQSVNIKKINVCSDIGHNDRLYIYIYTCTYIYIYVYIYIHMYM